MHPFRITGQQFMSSNYRGKIFFSYVALNGLLFHLFQKLIPLGSSYESCQSESAMQKVMRQCGFREVSTRVNPKHFLLTGTKPL
jgi:hypothetical protein